MASISAAASARAAAVEPVCTLVDSANGESPRFQSKPLRAP
jgi:hypothetical protein